MLQASKDWHVRQEIRAPYPGLRAFTREESQIFFGRDEQIDGLLERLGTSRLVAVTGESGCGKSSLVRAGLLPALSAGFLYGAGARWLIADFRPGHQPMKNLAAALAAALQGDRATAQGEAFLAARLRRGPRGLIEIFEERPVPRGTEVLILVDQFEEILRFRAREDQHEADAFVALLLETISHAHVPVRIALTLRTDYLGGCSMFSGLPEALNTCQYLTPRLEREQLLEAIVGPARVFDGDVDSTLANHLVNEIKQGRDQLPVLEHALLSMWSRAQARATRKTAPGGDVPRVVLDMDDYAELGSGLGESLSRHADVVYRSLGDPRKQRIAERLFCALWDSETTGNDARRPCTLQEAAKIAGTSEEEVRAVADVFRETEHSFLMPPRGQPLRRDTVLDVGHESLFRHWHQLGQWVRQEAEHVEKYRRWSGLARDWTDGKSNLLADKNLEAAESWFVAASPNEAWASRHGSDPDEFAITTRFLLDSRTAHATQERKRKRARNGIFVLVAIGFLAIWGGTSKLTAYLTTMQETERSVAESMERTRQQRFSVAAANALPSGPVRSMQLALEAQGTQTVPEAEAALRKALRASRFRGLIVASAGSFNDARFLPDGQRAVTIGDGDGLAIWNIKTGERQRAFHEAFRPRHLALDGKFAATAGEDGTVHVWDLDVGELLQTLEPRLAPVTALAINRERFLLAIASEDGNVGLWRIGDREPIHHFKDYLLARQIAFTRDGARLATSGEEGRVTLWDTKEGRKLGDLARDVNASALAFNASSRFLAAARQREVLIWDPIIRRLEGTLPHTSTVHSVAFSPEGDRLATVGQDGALQVWNARERSRLFRVLDEPALRGATQELVTPSARSSKCPAGDRACECSTGPREQCLGSVSFSADGRQVVTTTADGTAKFWSVESGGELGAFRAHESPIRRIIYSPSGRWFATASADGTAAAWTAEGDPIDRTPKLDGGRAIAFNPGGTQLLISEGGKLLFMDDKWKLKGELETNVERVLDMRTYAHQGLERVAIATGRRVEVWSTTTREYLFSVPPTEMDRIHTVAISADGRWLATECASGQPGIRQVCLWDPENGSRLAVLGPGTRPDAQRAAPAPDLPILDLQFSPDNKWLISVSEDRTIKGWNLAAPRSESVLVGYHEGVSGVAISADSRTIASSGSEWLKLWSIEPGAQLHGFPDAETSAHSVTFRPASSTLVSGGIDGVVRTYSLNTSELVSVARQVVPYALSDLECLWFLHERGCREKPTEIQREKAKIYSSRTGETDIDRFQSARLIGRASELVERELRRVYNEHRSRLEDERVPELAKNKLYRDLRQAVLYVQEQGKELLGRTREASEGQLRPDRFMSQIVTSELLALCRTLSALGHSELVPDILQIAPGLSLSSDRIHESAPLLTTGFAIASASKELSNGHPREAIKLLKRVAPPPDPLFAAWLRLVVKSYKDGSFLRLMEAAPVLPYVIQKAMAVGLALDDPEAIVDVVDILTLVKDRSSAAKLLERALMIDPDNSEALVKLGNLQAASGNYTGAVATLSRVSPFASRYRVASEMAGTLAVDKLKKPEDGYRLMLLGLEGTDAKHWANVAQAAWATGRLFDARLMAQRVLEGQEVSRPEPYVALAMRFVLIASLTRMGHLDEAERELRKLLDSVSRVESRSWNYEASRSAAAKIANPTERRFITALLDHVDSLGKSGDPETVTQLFRQLADPSKQ